MVSLQIISKILQTRDISILEDNQLTNDMFVDYREEIDYITDHYKEYHNVPDKLSFLSKFPKFDIVEVQESDDYLVNTIREEYLFSRYVPVVQNVAKLLKTDSNAAAEYLIHAIKDLQPNYKIGGTDIIHSAMDRYNAYIDRRDNQTNWFFTTGFPELDDIIHGIQRVEELFLIFARTNQGKSWILEKMCTHIWEIGFNVGYISPEMGELSVGYRFDTLYKHFSNKDMIWGNNTLDDAEYKKYIEELNKRKNKFIVATPKQFNNKITVTKLRQFIKTHKLDVIAIDGADYLSDERGNKTDTKAQTLTNIGADLMSLSVELSVPVLVVMQANRNGVTDKDNEDTPELESIRGGDGLSVSASKIISLKQSNDGVITLQVKKQRNGVVGTKVQYQWQPNIGEFICYGTPNTQSTPDRKKKPVEKEDVF